jgi:D-alanyl-D-alanine carboxypeptidase (penicillin-binding protein 5/6)
MRIVDMVEIQGYQNKHRHKNRLRLFVSILIIVFFVGLGMAITVYNHHLPILEPTSNTISLPNHQVTLNWPESGQSAVGGIGYGVLATQGTQQSAPMASVAKVMTALAVLTKHPLAIQNQGPLITFTPNDVALYNAYVSQGGSVVPVNAGEQISEYQALQAMLLPSANNIADSLAIWSFGSINNYLDYANTLAQKLQLSQTHIADASGFLAGSVSSAHDLVLLGQAAMQVPVLADIVSHSSASVPVAGTVDNVNYLLGQNGIIGIKTGNTTEAGGCYLFAAKHLYGRSQTVTIIGAIMGSPSLNDAMTQALPLLQSSIQGFGTVDIVKVGESIGFFHTPWGEGASVVTQQSLHIFGWLADKPVATIQLANLSSPRPKGYQVGSLVVQTKDGKQIIPLVLASKISNPSWSWRISHLRNN